MIKSTLLTVLIFIVAIVAIMWTIEAKAQPAYLKGATVTVTLKNGQTHTFSSKEWKVVPRLEKYIKPIKPIVIEIINKPLKRHRISFSGGFGPGGLKTENVPNGYKVSPKRDVVFGMGYSYKVDDVLSLGGRVLSNETFLFEAGVDF